MWETCDIKFLYHMLFVVYYESIKREPKIRGIYECRCDERLQTKTKEFTRLTYTGFFLFSASHKMGLFRSPSCFIPANSSFCTRNATCGTNPPIVTNVIATSRRRQVSGRGGQEYRSKQRGKKNYSQEMIVCQRGKRT